MGFFSDQIEAECLYGLHFDSMILTPEQLKGINITSLYPYRSIELSVVLIYEKDYQRNVDLFTIPVSVQLVVGLIALFVFLAAIALWVIRWKLNRVRNSFVVA